MGQRDTIAIDMNTLVDESRLERLYRMVLLAGIPLSVIAFVAI